MAWLPQRLLLPPAHAAAAAARGGPAAADASPHAAAVFAGLASSACTDASGHVYTWGLGGTHQLGHGGPHDEWSPRLVRKGPCWKAAIPHVHPHTLPSPCFRLYSCHKRLVAEVTRKALVMSSRAMP